MPTAGALPDRVSTCLFDLDGVLTQTAKVHAAAWKEVFDAFLLERSRETGEETRPFELPGTTSTMSTGSFARTASDRFSRRAASRSRRGRPTTRP
jgi:beta-phosphoglucomutase-like phosphatase (HAD superfamily)